MNEAANTPESLKDDARSTTDPVTPKFSPEPSENTLEEKVESHSEPQEEPRQLEIEESPAHESPQKSEEKMEEELIDENSEIDNSEMETESKPNDETKASYRISKYLLKITTSFQECFDEIESNSVKRPIDSPSSVTTSESSVRPNKRKRKGTPARHVQVFRNYSLLKD